MFCWLRNLRQLEFIQIFLVFYHYLLNIWWYILLWMCDPSVWFDTKQVFHLEL